MISSSPSVAAAYVVGELPDVLGVEGGVAIGRRHVPGLGQAAPAASATTTAARQGRACKDGRIGLMASLLRIVGRACLRLLPTAR